ncbi:MAG: bifunctional adenosylcobinamide kinase/adenosylcobinamide-phosphate guanylyltransferase [Deltaproteobacteria bacterium]|nr:bifunctional adenosylcobinamide kinase/adenosylcobinamide-phosphate guanylyltransferase [Deltaproteobacteria bacterium]
MKEIIFVIGGCRSGKSSHALQTAEKMPQDSKIYIATCVPQDDEMRQRVAKHQKERSQSWGTLEVPVDLPQAILENSRKENVILADCLTLWLSNLLMETDDEKKLEKMIDRLTAALEKAPGTIVLVSNEIGTGIVPENKLARQYRDIIGLANQAVAKTAGKVIWMVAGIPVTIKG